MKHHWKPLKISKTLLKSLWKVENIIKKDYMMIIIMHGPLISQTITESTWKQQEEGQMVKDNGGRFTCKILFLYTLDGCLTMFGVLFILQ